MSINPAAMTALVGTAALALLPFVVPAYYTGLMISFFGYAIALLGFNLLFGYAGLLSFGHAMFLGLGAYGAAVMSGTLGVKHFELVLLAVIVGSALIALPIALLCARYIGIFFGMLTLAFGMLFYSFLFKFYHLTGGDSGMRVPRMNILGLTFERYNKIEFLAGPFYYYCLALLVVAGLVMGGLCIRLLDCTCRPCATMRARPSISAFMCINFAPQRSSSPPLLVRSAGLSLVFASAWQIPNWFIGPTPVNSSSWPCSAAFQTFLDPSLAR